MLDIFVRLRARETKWLTKCWSKPSQLTNYRIYKEPIYQNEVVKSLLAGSTTPSLHNPHFWHGWRKLVKLTNHRAYQELKYRKDVLTTGSTYLSLPSFPTVSRNVFRSAFLTVLEPWKVYKWCYSLYVSVKNHVACGTCVIRKARQTLCWLYFYASVGARNDVIKRRTWSVVFAAVLPIRKFFWLWIFDNRSILSRNLNKLK